MSRTQWSTALALLLGIGMLPLHTGPIAGAENPPVRLSPVRVEPTEAPPFGSVRVFGVRCGEPWGRHNLIGFELNSVEDAPEHDEGVTLWAHEIRVEQDGTLSASFTVPEIPPGRYYLFYLCADAEEVRAFRAMPPPDGLFPVIRRLPLVTAPPQLDPTPDQFLRGSIPIIVVALVPVATLLLMHIWAHTAFARRQRPADRGDDA